jgi:hypothetical protein
MPPDELGRTIFAIRKQAGGLSPIVNLTFEGSAHEVGRIARDPRIDTFPQCKGIQVHKIIEKLGHYGG